MGCIVASLRDVEICWGVGDPSSEQAGVLLLLGFHCAAFA